MPKGKNALKVDNGHYYKWKEGNIFYTKTGTGEPILLIHDTDSGASGEEWAKVAKKLAKNNTVYTIDLLGCGRWTSLPSNIQDYMYVQIITAFVNDVIGKPVNSSCNQSFNSSCNHGKCSVKGFI